MLSFRLAKPDYERLARQAGAEPLATACARWVVAGARAEADAASQHAAPGTDEHGRAQVLVDTAKIRPLHEVTDPLKAATIAASMALHGWVGAPVVAVRDVWDEWYALTGTHRLTAACAAGIPCRVLDLTKETRAHLRASDEGWRIDTTPEDGAAWAWIDAAVAVVGREAAASYYGLEVGPTESE